MEELYYRLDTARARLRETKRNIARCKAWDAANEKELVEIVKDMLHLPDGKMTPEMYSTLWFDIDEMVERLDRRVADAESTIVDADVATAAVAVNTSVVLSSIVRSYSMSALMMRDLYD